MLDDSSRDRTFSLIDWARLFVTFTSILVEALSLLSPALTFDCFRMFIITDAVQQIASIYFISVAPLGS